MIIYKIQNKLNSKIYIGQTSRPLRERIRRHLGTAGCPCIHNAFNKYGIENFNISIIKENINTIEETNILEKKYIKEFDCISPRGYNLYDGGLNTIPNEEVRRKISKKRSGIKHTEEAKLKMSIAMKKIWETRDRVFSDEHKRRIGESNKEKVRTEDTRRRLSESHKGHVVSEETRKKISENSKNMSEETRRKISEKLKGRVFSEEHKRKLSEFQIGEKSFMFGKHHSEKTKRKISESLKKKRLSSKGDDIIEFKRCNSS